MAAEGGGCMWRQIDTPNQSKVEIYEIIPLNSIRQHIANELFTRYVRPSQQNVFFVNACMCVTIGIETSVQLFIFVYFFFIK